MPVATKINYGFCLLMALFLVLAGCGKEELLPNAAITFVPEADKVRMSPGEAFTLQVRTGPAGKIKQLVIERSALGQVHQFPVVTSFADSAYLFSDQIDAAAPDSSIVKYTFTATTTDDKVTVRTFTVTVSEMRTWANVKLGAGANTTFGHYYSTATNSVFLQDSSAKQNAAIIDFVFFNKANLASDSLSQYGPTIASPASDNAALAYPSDTASSGGVANWPIRNQTRFKRGQPSDFDLVGAYAIQNAWNAIAEDEEEEQIDQLSQNTVFFFVTDEGKIGLCRVSEISASPSAGAGFIVLDVRVQK